MRKFWVLLVIAFVLGGLIGAEIKEISFSILGATIALVLTASVVLSLGAYFDHQEEKKKNKDIPPEVRRIFAGMVNAMQETDSLVARAKKQPQEEPAEKDNFSEVFLSIKKFIQTTESWPEEENIAAMQLMTNIINGEFADNELTRSLLAKITLRNRTMFMLHAKQLKDQMK